MFKRPTITDNDALDAGGLTWTMVRPFEELRVDYDGKVVMLDDPTQMADPKAAFTNNPYAECEVHLTFTGQGRAEHVRRRARRAPRDSRARSSPRATTSSSWPAPASIRVGDEEWEIDGFGLRDHSWGPRYWQAPWYYRWLTANVGADFGFMAVASPRRDGPGTRGGFVWEDGRAPPLRRRRASSTDFEGDDRYHQRDPGHPARRAAATATWKFTGEVLNLIPLRNRRRDPTATSWSPASARA